MKKLIFIIFFLTLGHTEFDSKNFLGVEAKAYPDSSQKKYNLALTFQNQSKITHKYFNIYSRFDGTYDIKDKKRNEFLVNELYLLKSFENMDITLGKQIFFQGSLEGYNPTNFLNPQNYKKDMFQTHKKGSYMGTLKYFFENESNMALLVKLPQRKVKLAGKDYEFYPFGNKDYSKKIIYKDKTTPDFMASYGFSLSEDSYSGDFTFGIYDGQDAYKKPIFKDNRFTFNGFRATKFFTYDTVAIGDWLLKFEGIYTKPHDKSVQKDDFYDVGLGGEYSIANIYQSHTLGIISEYYKSNAIFNSFNNEIFLAFRYSLNDKEASEFLLGFIKDTKKSDQGVYLKYEGRLFDEVKLSSDFRYSKANNNETIKLGVELRYYF